MTLLNRYESRLRRIHKQAHAMLLRLRQERVSEPAPPEPPPAPALTPELTPVSDAPEVSAPPTPAAPPPAIPLTEARCSHENKVVQADSQPARLPESITNYQREDEFTTSA